MPIIPFLTDEWQQITLEQAKTLALNADNHFKNGHMIGWGRRFSILYFRKSYYAINSAYGIYHLENLVEWLILQNTECDDYSAYLNQGMKELNI